MQMNKEDEIALEASIAAWERRRDTGEVVDCPLCELGEKRDGEGNSCQNCIIAKHTGAEGCSGTPFFRDSHRPNYHQLMIAFLESLRPKKGELMNKNNDYVLNDRARKALRASREEKWEGIKNGTVVDEGPRNCALCKEYRVTALPSEGTHCSGCPVYAKTGKTGCVDTPFDEWEKHQTEEHYMCDENIIHCQTCADICDRGIAFLEGLEVEEEKPADVVISFKSRQEYDAFYNMLKTNVSVPDVVRCTGTDKAILRDWMDRTRGEIEGR